MPAKRPYGDALCIWLIVEALRSRPGGTQDAAFTEIRDGFIPLSSRKRGTSASFDTETGKIVGDQLSYDRIEGLYKAAQRQLSNDPLLRSEVQERLERLKAVLLEKPDTTFLPFRETGPSKGVVQWWVLQRSPGEKPVFHLANEPPPGYGIAVFQASNPNGPFKK